MNLLIFANGPGELLERAVPFAKLAKENNSKNTVYLILTPCQFSSGMEFRIAKNLNFFDGVFTLKKLPYLFSYFSRKKINAIFHLGGDILYPSLFSLILKVSCFSYGNFFIKSRRCKYLVPYSNVIYNAIGKEIPLNNVFFTGNFSFFVTSFSTSFSKDGKWRIGLFPGSRRLQFEHIFPFFVKVLDYLFESGYMLEPKLFLSPFIDFDLLVQIINKGPTYKVLDYSKVNIYKDNEKDFYLVSEKGHKINIASSWEMKEIDIALTTPGTSTLTLSSFGIPMLVVAPFNKIEKIPLNGIANFVEYIPYFGPLFKKKLVYSYLSKREFLALPNIIENKELVDEIKGILTFRDVGERIKKMISSRKKLYDTKRKLINLAFEYKMRKTKITREINRYV